MDSVQYFPTRANTFDWAAMSVFYSSVQWVMRKEPSAHLAWLRISEYRLVKFPKGDRGLLQALKDRFKMTETAPDVGEHEGNIPSFRYHRGKHYKWMFLKRLQFKASTRDRGCRRLAR